MEKSILPAAQWIRAVHLLKAAVDLVDEEQPTGHTCRESKVTTSCPSLAGDFTCCAGQGVSTLATNPVHREAVGWRAGSELCKRVEESRHGPVAGRAG